MKRLIVPAALAFALAAPLTTAKADTKTYDFTGSNCITMSLTFCGSVTVTTATSAAGTQVSFSVSNMSSGTPLAVFTAIGLKNSAINSAGLTGLSVTQGTSDFTADWRLGPGSIGGVSIQAVASTAGEALLNSISSQCGGSAPRIYTCAGASPVTISFFATGSSFSNQGSSLYVNAVAENGACVGGSNCEQTTTTPEPASLALFATGLLGMGAPLSRWRRRRDS